MSEKGFVTIENFLNLQDRLRECQQILMAAGVHQKVPKEHDKKDWYYDSRFGWLKQEKPKQTGTFEGVATADELERNFEIPSIRLDKKPQT